MAKVYEITTSYSLDGRKLDEKITGIGGTDPTERLAELLRPMIQKELREGAAQ